MIVLDASAALELLLRAGNHPGLVARVLELGETIGAVVITCDGRLSAVPGIRAAVEVITI